MKEFKKQFSRQLNLIAWALKWQTILLRYLLTEQDKGGTPDTKADNIALGVLDRPDNIDPSIHSIVRVEMHRLRKTLSALIRGQIVIPPFLVGV